MAEPDTEKNASSKPLLASTFVWLVVFSALVEWGIREIRPLRYFNHTGLTTINQNFLVAKLPPIMAAADNPDVVLMGSSLVLVPSVRLDDSFHGRKTRYDRWYYRNVIDEYSKADFFENALSKSTGKKSRVLDLAVAASMMSDQYLILKKYLDSGHDPNLIVLGIAPRDFLDNLRKDPEKTPTYSILADLTCVKDLFEENRSKEAIAGFALGVISDAYKNRADYKTFIAGLASRVSGHPVDMYQATAQATESGQQTKGADDSENADNLFKADVAVLDAAKADYAPRPNRLRDLTEYRRIYLPVNDKLYETQMSYLDRFLSLAKQAEIPVVLVEMPVTKENFSLLPDDVVQRFRNDVAGLATRYGATTLKPQESVAFDTMSDFEDSVHMNASGGKKVFEHVAVEIGQDRMLASRWLTRKRRVAFGLESLGISLPF